MNYIIESFLSKDTAVERRTYCIWYAVFFLRIWKSWIRRKKSLYNEKNNYLSSNCYMCVELNAHALIKLLELFIINKDLNNSMFLPWLYSSQMCEKIFRATRSLTSTYSTVVNFSMLNILHRLNRIETINNLTHDLSDILSQEKKKQKLINPDSNQFLAATSEKDFKNKIEVIVNSALEDAILDTKKLGIKVRKGIWNKVCHSSNKKRTVRNKIQTRISKVKKSTVENMCITKGVNVGSDEESEKDEDEIYIDDEQMILDQEINEENVDLDGLDEKSVINENGTPVDFELDFEVDVFDISLLRNAGESLLLRDYSDKGKRSKMSIRSGSDFYSKGPFVRVLIKDKISVVRKSSLCWMLSTEKQRVSSDRLRRFFCDSQSVITQKNSMIDSVVRVEKSERLRIGDWCLFYNSGVKNTRSKNNNLDNNHKSNLDNYIFGRILFFKDVSKRTSKTKLTWVQSNAVGIKCFCTWYNVQNNGKLTHSSSFRHEFYDITYYRFSLPNPSVIPNEETDTMDLVLEDKVLSDLQKEIDCSGNESSSSASAIVECDNFAIDRNTTFVDYSSSSSDSNQDLELWEVDDSVDDDNEDCSSSEELPCVDIAHSCEKKIDIKVENYYAVFYDDSWYIGRVIEIIDNSNSRVKFLKENLHQFLWPKHDDIQQVENKYIYQGPITLLGSGPFSLPETVRDQITNNFKIIKRKYK